MEGFGGLGKTVAVMSLRKAQVLNTYEYAMRCVVNVRQP